MNAIAQVLHDRAHAPDVHHDPHLMHGLLLLREEGISERTLALSIGFSTVEIRAMLNRACKGELRRATAWMGEKYRLPQLETKACKVRATLKPVGREMFVTPWYRDAISLMVRPQGLMTRHIVEIAHKRRMASEVNELMRRLKGALQREGFAFEVQQDADGREARYTLTGKDADRMIRIIDAGWFEATE